MVTEEDKSSIKCNDVIGEGSFDLAPEYSAGIRYVILGSLVTFSFLTFLGNSMMIIAVITHKRLQNLSSVFVISLTVADLMIAMFVMPVGIYQQFKNLKWELGKDLCVITTCLGKMLTTVSIYSICCISINKYFVICKPFLGQMRLPNVVLLLALCWILPIFISFVPMFYDWYHIGPKKYNECPYSSADHPICAFGVNKRLVTLDSVLEFFIPGIIMVFCYFRIYKIAKRHAHCIFRHTLDAHLKKNLKYETRAKRTLLAIFGCFFVCWFPYFLLKIIVLVSGHKIPHITWLVVFWLGYVNSMLNPVLFYKYHRQYKNAFRRIVSGQLCRGISEFEYDVVARETPFELNYFVSGSPKKVTERQNSDHCKPLVKQFKDE